MARKKRIGRPIIHGGRSLIYRDQLIDRNKRLKRFLEEKREGLVSDLGNDLSTAREIILDRAISKLGVIRLVELYVAKTGALTPEGDLKPILNLYLSWTRELRNDLSALGLDRREDADSVTLAEIIKEKTERTDEKSRQDALGEAIDVEEGERVEE